MAVAVVNSASAAMEGEGKQNQQQVAQQQAEKLIAEMLEDKDGPGGEAGGEGVVGGSGNAQNESVQGRGNAAQEGAEGKKKGGNALLDVVEAPLDDDGTPLNEYYSRGTTAAPGGFGNSGAGANLSANDENPQGRVSGRKSAKLQINGIGHDDADEGTAGPVNANPININVVSYNTLLSPLQQTDIMQAFYVDRCLAHRNWCRARGFADQALCFDNLAVLFEDRVEAFNQHWILTNTRRFILEKLECTGKLVELFEQGVGCYIHGNWWFLYVGRCASD